MLDYVRELDLPEDDARDTRSEDDESLWVYPHARRSEERHEANASVLARLLQRV